jgi:hypothetical protein
MNDTIVDEIINGVTALFFGVTIIICVTWIVINVLRSLKQRANTKTRAEIYSRLIDKFGTAPEFIAFLQSDAGLKFIEENAVQNVAPLGKILAALQIGTILTLVGIGLLMLGNIFGGSLGGDLYIVLTVGGTVGFMVGIGFLISSAISYRLCKTWGILTASGKLQTDKVNVSTTEN